MVPLAVLQGHGEDVHHRVVQGLAGGVRVELLRVVRTGADDVVGVVAGVQDDGLDLRQVADLLAHAAGQVDRGLGLVLRGVLLGVGVQDAALLLAGAGQRDGVVGVLAVEHPGDEAVLALPDGGGAPSPRIARSTDSMAILPAKAGAKAFQELIRPLRD